MERLRANLAYHAAELWKAMADKSCSIPITHDFYLKLWALSNPELSADFIIFDEAQDANPVMVDLVTKQSCQKIFAGDPFQLSLSNLARKYLQVIHFSKSILGVEQSMPFKHLTISQLISQSLSALDKLLQISQRTSFTLITLQITVCQLFKEMRILIQKYQLF